MSLELLRNFADMLPDACVLVSGGTILAANRASARLLGRSQQQLRDRPITEFVADSDESVAAYLRACARTREKFLGTLRLIDTGGQEIPCRSEGSTLQPAAPGVDALLLLRLIPRRETVSRFLALNQQIEALNKEIHRRRQAEEKLREQRQWLSVTLSSIGDAVIATDIEGRIILMNRIAETLTGWPHAEAVGRPLEDVFHIIDEETRSTAENPVTIALRSCVKIT